MCQRYNFKEIRTPIFENTELFVRGVGETTDIVEKEMYTFLDKSDRSMSLRPEGTAGVVRAYVENKLYGEPDVSKLYYIGPMFRYEAVQAGRYRQLHQFGVEAFGSVDPAIDAEVISLAISLYGAGPQGHPRGDQQRGKSREPGLVPGSSAELFLPQSRISCVKTASPGMTETRCVYSIAKSTRSSFGARLSCWSIWMRRASATFKR